MAEPYFLLPSHLRVSCKCAEGGVLKGEWTGRQRPGVL